MEANPRIRGRLADVIVGTGPKQLKRIVAAGQQIVATDRHPSYTANTGEWTDAANLQQGDQLVGADGSLQTVSALIDADHTTTVYNLTVDDIHTYYAGDAPVLVHNCGELGQPGALRQAVDVHNMVTDSRRHRQSTFALAEVRMPDGARQIFASGPRAACRALSRIGCTSWACHAETSVAEAHTRRSISSTRCPKVQVLYVGESRGPDTTSRSRARPVGPVYKTQWRVRQ